MSASGRGLTAISSGIEPTAGGPPVSFTSWPRFSSRYCRSMWSAISSAPLNGSVVDGFHADQFGAKLSSRSSLPVTSISASAPAAIAQPSSAPVTNPKRARKGDGPGGAAAGAGAGSPTACASGSSCGSGSGDGRPAGEGGGIRSPATRHRP
jgi:hypothetical protein